MSCLVDWKQKDSPPSAVQGSSCCSVDQARTCLEDTLSGNTLGLGTEGDTLVGGSILEDKSSDGRSLSLIAGRGGDRRVRQRIDNNGLGHRGRARDLGGRHYGILIKMWGRRNGEG